MEKGYRGMLWAMEQPEWFRAVFWTRKLRKGLGKRYRQQGKAQKMMMRRGKRHA